MAGTAMKGRDANDVLRERGADALRASFDYDAVRHKPNGSAAPAAHQAEADRVARAKRLTHRAGVLPTSRVTDWRVAYVLPRVGAGLLVGTGGTFKTGIAAELALSVATGQPFFGHRVTEPAGVLFLVGEGSVQHTQRRVVAAMRRHRLEEAPLARFVLREQPPRLLESDEVRAAIAAATDNMGQPPRLLVVDTLSALGSGESDNNDDAARKMCATLRALAAEHAACIVSVHHTPRGAERERGSTVWRDDSDFIAIVRASTPAQVSAKQEAGSEFGDFYLTLDRSRFGERIECVGSYRPGIESFGEDDAGLKITAPTIVVVTGAGDAPPEPKVDGAPAPKPKREKQALTIARTAFGNAFRDHPSTSADGRRGVNLHAFKAAFETEFAALYRARSIADDDTPAARKRFADALRRAYANGLEALQEGENWSVEPSPDGSGFISRQARLTP